ncbi:hypothetical protein [Limosilactobacillus mucosae]|uniref:Uncharacterized protein n=1 Tax=Limosilactobacillus mucosae TaxID=97478 RepID=A0A508YNH0_LIMMU|nr:hypothetical protein [Limosilactobacillus mucosae]VTZ90307.1 hypothetical protein LMUP508_01110 [Limosilactobacillus mucosae]
MNKEKRVKKVAKTAQKAIGTFNCTINELPELEATELLIILYGVFLDVANNLELDPDSLYFFMKESIGYTKTADGYALNFPSDLIQGDDE